MLQREPDIVQILLRHRGQIQTSRRIVGMILNGAGKKLGGFAGATALETRQPQSIQGLGIVGAQRQSGAEAFLRRNEITGAQLGRPQLEPALRRVAATQGVGGKLRLGLRQPVLLQPERTEIIMRLHQIPVEDQGALIGDRRLSRLSSALAGDAQIIPSLRIGGQQGSGRFQFLHGGGGIPALQKRLSPQQGARARRGASGDN